MIHLKVVRKSLLLLKYEFGEFKKMYKIWDQEFEHLTKCEV